MNKKNFSSSKSYLWASIATILLAIVDHTYLLHEHYLLRFGQIEAKSLCNINELFNCAAVSASRFSEFLGVPMALWGIAANAVLLLLTVWHLFTDDDGVDISRRNILLVSGFIALTSIIMGSISTFVVGRLCPFCIVAYALSFISFGLLLKALGQPQRNSLAFSAKGLSPVAIMSTIALVIGFIGNEQLQAQYGARDMSLINKEAVTAWQSAPTLKITPLEPLVLGEPVEKAKMTIVEFADFLCPHCKHAAPVLKAFTESHPGVRLEFETWPLDGECNTAIPVRRGSPCMLARVVNCAQRISNNGWRAHAFIYDHQDQLTSVESIRSQLPMIAESALTPADKLSACVDSEETKKLIENQAAIGTALNIPGTPAIYINGKQLSGPHSIDVLSAIYESIH
jgi:protein-disulfide isomerase